jgi:hypothetical protein
MAFGAPAWRSRYRGEPSERHSSTDCLCNVRHVRWWLPDMGGHAEGVCS